MTAGPVSGQHGESREESADLDEVLNLGSSRARWFDRLLAAPQTRRTPARAALGLALLALAAVFTSWPASHGRTDRESAPAARADVAQVSMTAIRALAARPHPLGDYVRQSSQPGGCALVAVGSSPEPAIANVVRRALPDYAVEDAGVTLDQFTGLCAIEVRATYRQATLVISIASPSSHRVRSAYTSIETGIETDGIVTTKYAFAVNESGWSILVGATGPTDELPGAEDLAQIAQEPALIW